MTVHNKTNHIAQDTNLRYRAKVIIGDFSLFNIGESFLYTKICVVASRTLYLQRYGTKNSAM